ncbi:MAG: hypothetical protein V7695_05815 [Sulfitobacter sp.]
MNRKKRAQRRYRPRCRPTPSTPPASWIKRNDTTFKLLLAALGLLIGLNEYLQRQHDNRIQRSLGIYERYQAVAVLESRLGIDRVWNAPEFWEELKDRHEEDGRLFYDRTANLALTVTQDRNVVDNLFVVWSIASEASLCLIRGQCDQATICQSFFHDTQKYHGFFEPYFDARNFAWDETIQNREKTTIRILNSYCGSRKFRHLYDRLEPRAGICGRWDAARRGYHEAFNVLVGSLVLVQPGGKDEGWAICSIPQ